MDILSAVVEVGTRLVDKVIEISASVMTFVDKHTRSDADIHEAVNLWCSNRAEARTKYGHIEDWDVSEVTNMDYAFCYKKLFEGDLSRWDVSRVTKMAQSK